jgi:hypothetical protein
MSAKDAARVIKDKFKLGGPPGTSETKGSLAIGAHHPEPVMNR